MEDCRGWTFFHHHGVQVLQGHCGLCSLEMGSIQDSWSRLSLDAGEGLEFSTQYSRFMPPYEALKETFSIKFQVRACCLPRHHYSQGERVY